MACFRLNRVGTRLQRESAPTDGKRTPGNLTRASPCQLKKAEALAAAVV
jgi:hypothetical protein